MTSGTYAAEIEFIQSPTVATRDPEWAGLAITSVDLTVLRAFIEQSIQEQRSELEEMAGLSQVELESNFAHLAATHLDNLIASHTLEKAIAYYLSFFPSDQSVSRLWRSNPTLTSTGVRWARRGHFADKVGKEVWRRFSQISEVAAIYQKSAGNELLFWVFSSEERYDGALMDTLLDAEIEILNTYQEVFITFRYVPLALCENPLEVTGNNAKLIFER